MWRRPPGRPTTPTRRATSLDGSRRVWSRPDSLSALDAFVSGTATAIERIRDETGYRRVLEYRTTDRRKIPYCEKLFDYVFGAEDIRFVAATLTAGEPATKNNRPQVMSARVHALTTFGSGSPDW